MVVTLVMPQLVVNELDVEVHLADVLRFVGVQLARVEEQVYAAHAVTTLNRNLGTDECPADAQLAHELADMGL